MKQYLHLTPHQFDQDISWWWRFLCNQWLVDYVSNDKKDHLGISNAIEIMKFYIHRYQFTLEDLYMRQLIEFHIGQLYAYVWDYDHALWYFTELYDQWYRGVWIEYLQFTIAFLCWEQQLCESLVRWSLSTWSISNIDTMQRMMEFWWSSYLEAYSGMELNWLKEYLLSHK